MAKGFKTGGRDWPKGQSANPAGRPAILPEIKEARKANANDLTRILHTQLKMSRDELKEILSNKETPAMDLLVANILSKAIVSGDQTRAGFLFDRAFGKLPEKHGFDGSAHALLVQLMKGLGDSNE